MAITHYLKFNWNTTDSIAWTWTVNGTFTSQPTQWIAGNYYANTGNLSLTETATLTTGTVVLFAKNRSTSDTDGKVFDARGTWNFILAWTPWTTKLWIYRNATHTECTLWTWTTNLHICWRFDGTNVKIFVDGIEKTSSASSWSCQYTSIRIAQENAGSPNRRFLGDYDQLRLYNHSLSVAEIRNDRLFYKWYF